MVSIRDYRTSDAAQVLALNQVCVPEVGSIDMKRLTELTEWAANIRVAEKNETVVGLLFVMLPGSGYDSPNYRWFADRYTSFAYVDRIAIDSSVRGEGVGGLLYEETINWARHKGMAYLCAEVNTVPPNPGSLRFHEAAGFDRVGEFEPYGKADYRVAMLVRELN